MLCGVWTGGDWGKGTNLRKPRRSGDEDSGSKSGLALRVFRFAEVEKDSGPIVLWISVKPGSLSREDAQVATVGCKKILDKFEITDVEVAFRVLLFTWYSVKLFKYVSSTNATTGVPGPFYRFTGHAVR